MSLYRKYLLVTYDVSGRWISGDIYTSFVFEAKTDVEAAQIAGKYLGSGAKKALDFFGCIKQGLVVEELVATEPHRDKTIPSIDELRERDECTFLGSGSHLIQQLQPFRSEERLRRNTNKVEQKKRKERTRRLAASVPVPKVGDDIYVPPRLFVFRGRDDAAGGLATVKTVTKGMSGGEAVHFVTVKEIPGSFNWEHGLALEQTQLRVMFGDSRAHPDPDLSPEYNDG